MFEKLRRPRLNAVLLGLLQGVPEGLRLGPHSSSAPALDNNILLVASFGLIAPPLLVALSFAMNRGRQTAFWRFVLQYLEPFHLISWGSASFALFGLLSLGAADASGG